MAFESSAELFIGTDQKYKFTILTLNRKTAIDVTGWLCSWMVKRLATDLDIAALITKTSAGGGIAIEGVFNADPKLNTQRVVVDVADTDSDALVSGRCVYELKRVDAVNEAVLAFGLLSLRRSVHHA